MKFILVFSLSVADKVISEMAKRDGYSDSNISKFSGEWYYGIERPYLPHFNREYVIQYPCAFSGTVHFTVDYICDDIINRVVQVHILFRDAEEGFASLIDSLKNGWKHTEKEYDTLVKWAAS